MTIRVMATEWTPWAVGWGMRAGERGVSSHLASGEASDPEGFGVTGSKCRAGHTPDLQLILDSSL